MTRKDSDMNYADVKYNDIANGPGIRTSLFVSGCRRHCEGCFNSEAWPFDYGSQFTDDTKAAIRKSLEPEWVDGITFLGGDPMEPENQDGLFPFIKELRASFDETNRLGDTERQKTIWLFSGYRYNDLIKQGYEKHTEHTDEILSCLDVLVDGPFVIDKKDLSLRFCGSSNQRVIDMNKTRDEGKVIIWKDDDMFE